MNQPHLFFELTLAAPPPVPNHKRGGHSVARRLYALRRQLNPDEMPFVGLINKTIEEIRVLSNSSGDALDKKILYAVEYQGCITFTEIAEDTKIHKDKVKEIVLDLRNRGVIRIVRRFVPGSDRQYYAIKSNRVDVGEMV